MSSPSNSPDTSAPTKSPLVLRFISGKYQGGEFPLTEGTPIVVGRSSDLDMVLVEEMVSRKHARIEVRSGVVHIEDLGSTNGTFVNGERIQKAPLRIGDRVLIGTSILKLVSVERSPSSSKHNLKQVALAKSKARRASPSSATRMSGNLEEIPLPDLMQLLGTSRKSGVLVLQSDDIGRLYLRDGLIQNAVIEGSPDVSPLKAAYRMLGWLQGTFSLEPPADEEPDEALALTAQELLMEGFRQLDELGGLRSELPDLGRRFVLKAPLEAPLHQLEQSQLDVLQIAINAPSFQSTLDRSPRSDLETARDVLLLMRKGYIKIEE